MSKIIDEKKHSFLPERALELNCIRAVDDQTSLESSDSDISDVKKDYDKRQTWTGKLDFILSCIGYAVGLGNIWRFPYLCYKNGGGAFLVPYFIFLVLCGMPMFVLELCFGQFGSSGPITLFRISPIFKGVGYGMLIISGIVCIYYNVIITWTLYYLYLSFSSHLPWASCDNYWNSNKCFAANQNTTTTNLTALLVTNTTRVSSTEEFWNNYVLQLSDGIEQLGGIRYELLLTLFIAWVIVFACLFKGVESSGKVVYVSATFPYLVLTILLIRVVSLEGATSGIIYLFKPDWTMLTESRVWGYAASQLFYSVGAAWGSVLTMASYNKFHHQCYRDAILVPVINCFTSLFAGVVVFSIIGFMAHITNSDIEHVIKSGPGLVFIVYPEAVAKMPLAPLWSILFFVMILTIGIDSQFGMFECVISGIIDENPSLRSKKIIFTAALCGLLFFLGIPCVTRSGAFILSLIDAYAASFSLMSLCLLECLVISWIYGDERFSRDVEMMIGYRPHKWFRLCWRYITPACVVVILVLSMAHYQPLTYEGRYNYPDWSIALGWIIASLSMIPVPVCAVLVVLSKRGSLVQRILDSVRPDPMWGPRLHSDRVEYRKSLELVTARFPQRYVSGVEQGSVQSDSSESNAV